MTINVEKLEKIVIELGGHSELTIEKAFEVIQRIAGLTLPNVPAGQGLTIDPVGWFENIKWLEKHLPCLIGADVEIVCSLEYAYKLSQYF